jgi:ketosteroid isomerase-like protein
MKLRISALRISALALVAVCQATANAYAQMAPIVQCLPRGQKKGAVAETEIRQRVENLARALSAKDIDAVMSFYAPDIVSFDIGPPLRYAGAALKRRAWQEVFAAYTGAFSYGVSELSVMADGELAFVHSLNQVKGTLANGHVNQMWVRWTACFRQINRVWLVVHDHVSVPADLEHAQALLNLTP